MWCTGSVPRMYSAVLVRSVLIRPKRVRNSSCVSRSGERSRPQAMSVTLITGMSSPVGQEAADSFPPRQFESKRDSSSELADRREQPLDVLGPRQPVVAVLDQGEHHVILCEARHQLDRVPPGDVGILDALQDAHRTAGLDQPTEQQMAAAVLD